MARFFYQVPALVDATGGMDADVPAGVSWVGAPCLEGDCYLVLVDAELPAPAMPVDLGHLPGCCQMPAGVLASWSIGGA